ncbi:MAG: hypothetical protein A3J48_03430 [Candidatus Doudnabacteria bacterium RIFCSPHIGHO2_02_FULL_46_11]|uniref:TVP38/TMEM64 family membrane protein n=1 Tax=Candidatus Doudnabacteria bacterium RIFCSPHIGHO2_02_FULL_46_11 TaxID=1817832 RepID=A0A1F5P4E2_9BACT|nr:MAG: hypothetical protein A3J48_03430 [Candidatus Doudnabacteria bacterium RIFCSPHIGHO2_02_FULL_46_11]
MDSYLLRYKKWQYKNTAFLIASLLVFFYFADSDFVQNTISRIGEMGYLGAFLAGMFFVSTFTVAPASVLLFFFAKTLPPIYVAVLAGAGAVIGDYIIFKFLKDKVFEEITPIFLRLGGNHISRTLRTPYFAWFLPVLGAIIVASPIPDEIGIGLMGISKMKNWQFLILSFVLNFIGIFIVITLAQSVGR